MATKDKVIKLGVDARISFAKGVDFLADAVAPTIGPFGTNFLLEKGDKNTNDGKNIASELGIYDDEIANRALTVARKSGIKAESEVQDGSTSCFLLTRKIFHACVALLPNERSMIGKKSPFEVTKQIQDEVEFINKELDSMSTPITSKEQLIASAKVSVQDDILAELIGSTQWDLGPEGIIIAEETSDTKSSIEIVKGIRIDNGMSQPLAINDFENQSLHIEDCPILLTNYEMINFEKQLKKILESIALAGYNKLTIVARAFNQEFLKSASVVSQAGLQIYPINAPYTDQNEIMQDLVAVHGGTYINNETHELSVCDMKDIGFVKKIDAKRWESTFTGIDDDKSKERITKRLGELSQKLTGEKSVFEQKNLKKRIAQLSTGFAILKVGSYTDSMRKTLKDKADDAVGAVRYALQDGVVPGAGISFMIISDKMPEDAILKNPIKIINQQIMLNSPKGFIVEDWVKDPAKVLKVILKYAAEDGSNLATAAGADAVARDKPRYMQEATPSSEEIN